MKHNELWINDCDSKGFCWISCDDNKNNVIAFRRIGNNSNEIIIVCNFCPIEREKYRIGVPFNCEYVEVFNSDAKCYGGYGTLNKNIINADKIPFHGYKYSIEVELPYMSAVYLKPKKLRKK